MSKSLFVRCLLSVSLLLFAAGIAMAEIPGTVSGEGTYFEVTDSDYLNVSVGSSENIGLFLQSVPESVYMEVTPLTSATSTVLTLGGLIANTTYFMSEDQNEPPVKFITDSTGGYSYEQDISIGHVVLIEPSQAMYTKELVQGTHFEYDSDDYLDVMIESSETILMTLESEQQVINFEIQAVSEATATWLTLSGLVPGATYYKYEDDLHNVEVITADGNGQHTYLQDISTTHLVHIQTQPSTKFIRDDATGGDCTSIGIWDPDTKTCTLTTDVNQAIQIDQNNITLDGNGHTITDPGGVFAGVTIRGNVEVKNITVRYFRVGINVYSSGGRIINNTLQHNDYGINAYRSSNNLFRGNTVVGGSFGMYIYRHSRNNTIMNNHVEGVWRYGIYLGDGTSYNNVRYNTVKRQQSGPYYWGWGIYTRANNDNTIVGNTIQGFWAGMYIERSDYSEIYNNNFIGNYVHVFFNPVWDQNYNVGNVFSYPPPVGGNYWFRGDVPYWSPCNDADGDGFCDSPFNFYGRTDYFPLAAPFVPPLNSPPHADAGPDQHIECPASASVDVTLDGTGSYDPDGDALTYVWDGPSGTLTGETPAVTLPQWGTHTIPLTVTDPSGASDTDTVVITAGDTIKPTTTATVLGTKDDTGTYYTSNVTVLLTAEDTCTGIAEIHYTINNNPEVVVTDTPETSFTLTEDGTYYITYWSVDEAGLISSGSISFDATPSAGGGGGSSTGGYYTSCVNVDLASVDGPEGEVLYYRVGDGAWTIYTGDFTICAERDTPVQYGYAPPSANVENPKSLTITIDQNPPQLILPADMTVEATGPAGAVVDFISLITVTDTVDPNPSLACTPASASTFPLGPTTVTCTATDAAGHSTSGSFTITVVDTTPPALTLPPDQLLEATGPDGAAVTFEPVAEDLVDPNPTITCSHSSGTFPIETTTVTCTATDSSANSTTGSFSVTVQDTTPPDITCPADISVLLHTPATDAAITAFLGGATATDIVDPDVTITHDAPSAYDTPGPVTVTFTTTDDYANSSTCSAVISVEYSFGGFLQPVSLLKPFKFGSTVPVKFQLTDANGAYVSTAHATLSLTQVSGDEPSGNPIDGSTNVPDSGNAFRYDLTDNHYIYNLSTDGLSVGTWRATVTLDDGETYSVDIGIK